MILDLSLARRRVNDPEFAEAVAAVRQAADAVVDRPVVVPDGGLAGWNHHFICPDHGRRLTFDWNSPHAHRCPVDGRIYRGPLLDAGWWRQVNERWAEGCVAMGLMWHLTGDDRYLEQVRRVLVAYAERYPDYEIHGGIPFNGPGKANVQTLCEATWLLSLAWAYDLVSASLSPDESRRVRVGLLEPGVQFLMEHHERQIHNHQCWIAAAIGTIGLVLQSAEWVKYAVNGPFGLAHQLDEGVDEDGFWLEGSVWYHMHALRALCKFAAPARGTCWDIRFHPKLQAMFRALRPMTLPDGTYPHINDAVGMDSPKAMIPMLEMAYGWDSDPELGALLSEALSGKLGEAPGAPAPRATLEALVFGHDRIQRINTLSPLSNYSSKGLSIVRSGGLCLVVKHGPGGNEHDHFDRLGLSFTVGGDQMAPDIGTVCYSHPMHWSWYKTTLSHNTVALGGLPHPPADAGVFRATDTLLDTWAAWPESQNCYSGARFRRIIFRAPSYFVDHFLVETKVPTRVEYVFHTRGRLKRAPAGRPYAEWNPLPPYRHLTDLRARPLAGPAALEWSFGSGARLGALIATPGLLIDGASPDCPWDRQRSTILLRQEEKTRTCVTVAYHFGADLRALTDRGGSILVECNGRTDEWHIK